MSLYHVYSYRALVEYRCTEPSFMIGVDGQCEWKGGDVASSSQTPQNNDRSEGGLNSGHESGGFAVIGYHEHIIELLYSRTAIDTYEIRVYFE